MKKDKRTARAARKERIHKRLAGTAMRPRLVVFRSLKNISAQLVDDEKSVTIVAASTLEKAEKKNKGNATCEGAKRIGHLIAERAKTKGIDHVVFDRSGFRFHGRVKMLAEAAREKGLKF